MKNKLTDVHNHLVAQLDRLGDEDLPSDPEKMDREINRSKAVAQVAGTIVSNGRLMLDAAKHLSENNGATLLPALITNGTDKGK